MDFMTLHPTTEWARRASAMEITRPQYNVLRVLRGAGIAGHPRHEISARVAEHAPGRHADSQSPRRSRLCQTNALCQGPPRVGRKDHRQGARAVADGGPNRLEGGAFDWELFEI